MTGFDPDTLISLRQAHARGDLDRQVFWQRMRDHHCLLRAYPALLEDGDVETIELTAAGLVVRLKSGLKYFWNPENLREPVSAAINHGTYEAFAGRVLARCAARASLVVDAGANIGWYAIRLASIMGAQGRVIAFEPVTETAATLDANIALNGLADRITVMRAGLSERRGGGEIFLPQETGHVGASLQDLHPEEVSRKIAINLTTLDDVLPLSDKSPLDLLKCDVEGAELMVLQGGRSVIERDRPILFLEILRKWSAAFGYHPNDVIAWARSLGYACWAVGETQLRLCENVADDTIETNYLFVQPDRDAALIDGLT